MHFKINFRRNRKSDEIQQNSAEGTQSNNISLLKIVNIETEHSKQIARTIITFKTLLNKFDVR